MSSVVWGPVFLAGVVALVAPAVSRPLLTKLGILDVPNQRSSHAKPTLRGGGIGPMLGFTIGGIWALVALPAELRLAHAVVLAAAVLMGLVGLAEDLRGLRVSVRAGLQILIGGAAAVILSWGFGVSWIWVPVAAVGFAAHVNFTNFMDGVNGISSLHGLVVGLAFAALGVVQEVPWLVTLGLITALAFLAFLPWNLTPPGMFLGDVGSYLLGGALGATAIAAIAAGLNPVAALAPLSIYWADTVATLLRRAGRGEPVFEPHRSHAYQRLTNTGLSHLAVAGTVAVFTLAASVAGLLAAASIIPTAPALLAVAVLAAGYLLLPRLRGDVLPARITSELMPVDLPPLSPARDQWSPRRWAVLGGTGFIGNALVQHLRALGIDVLPLSAPRLELDPRMDDGGRVATLAESLPETEHLAQRLIGADVVINAAGLATPDGGATEQLYGANSLLPAVVAIAGIRAGVGRVIHLSSAAVQGDRPVLDASPTVAPFSPYSRSKALGERAVLSVAGRRGQAAGSTDLVIIRATSVQGPGRPTTESLRRVARSPLASVAAPGDYPTVVSSLKGLVDFVHRAGISRNPVPAILLQPWEGLNVRGVLELAGGRSPVVLPRWVCRSILTLGKAGGRFVPRIAGVVRRVELMWFGQEQEPSPFRPGERPNPDYIRAVLQERKTSA